ncbi:hypothetical protein GCM10009687_71770 [Asanoa iriomotensis]|uniref:hypothetical protein n=1 Tax=Asanoa iriomotensis TaxID=234613 RepID=UPI0031CE1271
MTTGRWPDRAAAEALLDGGHGGTPLGRVLTAARGPAGPHEFVGEPEATAAFRASDRTTGPVRARRTLSRLLAIKVAIAGALLTGSGLAVASATGTLPIPDREEPRPAPAAPARPPAPAGEHTTRTPGPPPSASPSRKPKGPNEHARSPHPRRNTEQPTPGRKSPNPANTPNGQRQ